MNEFTYPFQTAYTQALELYGVEISEDEFETAGIVAWGRIGNKQTRLYRLSVTPERDDRFTWRVDLPCNADLIEAVTAYPEDADQTSNIYDVKDNTYIEEYIESGKTSTNVLYQSGGFVKYHREQNSLYFDKPYEKVNILYKGFVADEDGLPFLTEKEVDAIAAFIAYTTDLKAARITRDRNSFELANYMEQTWKRLCSAARVPQSLNQNEMDEILNVAASWDRKRFGKSFKPIR